MTGSRARAWLLDAFIATVAASAAVVPTYSPEWRMSEIIAPPKPQIRENTISAA